MRQGFFLRCFVRRQLRQGSAEALFDDGDGTLAARFVRQGQREGFA